MRICLLCYRGNPYCGGQGIYLRHLTRELTGQGHEVTVLVGPPYPDPMPWARIERLPNHQFWGRRSAFLPPEDPMAILGPLNFFEFATSRLGYFPEILAFSLRAAGRLRALHRERPFDVIHDVETLGYGLLLARSRALPAVSTVHHPLSRDMAAHLAHSRSWTERYYNVVFFPLIMQGIVARRVDAVITATEAGRKEIIRAFGVRPERIRVVLTGIDVHLFSPDEGVPRQSGEILFVGNAQDPRKGMWELLQALRLLPDGTHLTVVDEGEPAKPYAPALARSMGLSHRVSFTGRLSQEALVHRYRRAALLALPSRFEGFGLPVAEAMACGTPVVASRAGSLPEVLGQDGQGGILVPPGDPGALARAMSEILSRPAWARQLGAAARRRAEQCFSWERTARGTAEVYGSVMHRAKAPGAAGSEGNARWNGARTN
jgi:glycosyltransferase involved in cell wall biosynthesis